MESVYCLDSGISICAEWAQPTGKGLPQDYEWIVAHLDLDVYHNM